jgi:hypothetical protein
VLVDNNVPLPRLPATRTAREKWGIRLLQVQRPNSRRNGDMEWEASMGGR